MREVSKLLLELFLCMLKVGAFSFGGGYCMIPLLRAEVVDRYGWLSGSEFVDVIAVAEMTPGPIAVNLATFAGYKVAGVWGSMVATCGVILPSLLLMILVSGLFFRYKRLPILQLFFRGVRPAIVGLIAVAALMVSRVSMVDSPTFVIGSVVLILALGTSVHPVILIAGAGVSGLLIYYW